MPERLNPGQTTRIVNDPTLPLFVPRDPLLPRSLAPILAYSEPTSKFRKRVAPIRISEFPRILSLPYSGTENFISLTSGLLWLALLYPVLDAKLSDCDFTMIVKVQKWVGTARGIQFAFVRGFCICMLGG